MKGRLGSIEVPAGAVAAAYTVPAGQLVLSSVRVANCSGGPIKIRLAIGSGVAPQAHDYIDYDCPVIAGGTLEDIGLVLSAGETIWARADVAGATLNIMGTEIACGNASYQGPALDFYAAKSRAVDPRIACVRAGSATYIDPQTGKITVAAANTVRVESAGWLIESAATNHVRIDIATLTVGAVNPAPYSIAQAGTTVVSQDVPAIYADRVLKHQYSGVGDNNVGSQSALTLNGIPAASTICASFWLWIPAAYVGIIGLSLEGNVGSVNTDVMSVNYSKRDQWQRVAVRAVLSAGQTSTAMVMRVTGTTPLYTCAWNLTVGELVSSFIVPAATATTRAADRLTLTQASGALNPVEGTLYVEFDAAKQSAGWQTAVSINDGTLNNAIEAGRGGAGTTMFATIAAAGVETFGGNTFPGYQGNTTRCALAYKANSSQLAKDGAVNGVDATVTLPTVNQITLGSSPGGVNYLNGHITRLAIFTKRLPADVLQSITETGLPIMPGRLGSADLSPGVDTWLYTAPAQKSPTGNLRFCNRGSADVRVRVAIGGGLVPVTADFLTYDVIVPGNDILEDTGIFLSPNNSVWVRSDSAGVSVRMHGLDG